MWVGTSWKMNKTIAEAERYTRDLLRLLDAHGAGATIFVIPPFTALAAVCSIAAGSRLKIGAQNMHWEDAGAFTGEISPVMIRDCGAQLVELGHFERRTYFAETDETVNRKVLAALAHGLQPLVCIGETEQERDRGAAADVITRQVTVALDGVAPEQLAGVLVAYEPGWAIGAGGTDADPGYVAAMHARIRAAVAGSHGAEAAAPLEVLYGGSVNARNAGGFAGHTEIAGLFVGRAAWEVESFVGVIDAFCGATPAAGSARTRSRSAP